MKKLVKSIVSISFAATLAFSMDTTAFAKTKDVQLTNQLGASILQTQQQGIAAGVMSTDSLTGILPWYENTGTSVPEGHTLSYSKYRLLEVVQVGDIIYEAKGGYGVTGHSAIVEGKFYDEATHQWYIRMIESTAPGVIRSILEDTCVDDWEVHLLRVNGATQQDKQKAVEFCIGELGSKYNLDFAHDYSSDENDWYCSELVWAAYYNQGFDVETKGFPNEPGVTPRDIARSQTVTEIAIQ